MTEPDDDGNAVRNETDSKLAQDFLVLARQATTDARECRSAT